MEEKYEKALLKARVAKQNTESAVTIGILEEIFPELRDSEDEKIRKTMIDFFKHEREKDIELSELDKLMQVEQDEQKPFDYENADIQQKDFAPKVEPKFKVGDWIIFNGLTLYINEIVQGYYRTISKGGIINSYDWNIDNIARLWTIQDAKDGDILCCESGWTCIFKSLNSDNISFSSYCFMDKDRWFCETGSEGHTLEKSFIKAYNGNIYPSTKEQHDLLFQKMKEAGYEWDAEKKELKLLITNGGDFESTDEYEGLTDFERTLADVCVGYIGKELGWKQYIKDNANVLLRIANEQKSADKIEPKFKVGDIIRLKDGDGLEWTVEEVTAFPEDYDENSK